MIDVTHIRTRMGSDAHYVNVDVDQSEAGYLELNSSDEVVRAVVHDQHNQEHRELIGEIRRLAQPIVGAAASCGGNPLKP